MAMPERPRAGARFTFTRTAEDRYDVEVAFADRVVTSALTLTGGAPRFDPPPAGLPPWAEAHLAALAAQLARGGGLPRFRRWRAAPDEG